MYGEDYFSKCAVRILGRNKQTSATVAWSDATSCCYGEQLWRRCIAKKAGVCALSGQAIATGDAVYRPRLAQPVPRNIEAMILATVMEAIPVEEGAWRFQSGSSSTPLRLAGITTHESVLERQSRVSRKAANACSLKFLYSGSRGYTHQEVLMDRNPVYEWQRVQLQPAVDDNHVPLHVPDKNAVREYVSLFERHQ
jgi:hypothetical protein